MSEIAFDKYTVKGAYHWTECFGPVHRLNAYTIARYELVLKALTEAGVGKGHTVLDVGCGDAALSGLVAMRTGAEINGVDTTPLSIELARQEFARRKLTGRFAVIDGYTYPFPDAKFSAVVSSDVIEHVQKPADLLCEMWRVLAPGGVLIVTTPVRYTEAPLDRMHVQEWFPAEFRNFCAAALNAGVRQLLSHPVALTELYASPTFAGNVTRLSCNVLTKFGVNPFLWRSGFRAFSTQVAMAKKPA